MDLEKFQKIRKALPMVFVIVTPIAAAGAFSTGQHLIGAIDLLLTAYWIRVLTSEV
jgi:hypothetical protein